MFWELGFVIRDYMCRFVFCMNLQTNLISNNVPGVAAGAINTADTNDAIGASDAAGATDANGTMQPVHLIELMQQLC